MTSYIPKRIPIYNRIVTFKNNSARLDLLGISKLLLFISGVLSKYKTNAIMLFIDLGHVIFADKLTIQVLECVIYALITDYHYSVVINAPVKKTIDTESFQLSPLRFLGFQNNDIKKFSSVFRSNLSTKAYRRIIPKEWTYSEDLGVVYADIKNTIGYSITNDSFCAQIAEVATELINNANEHNQSDCLIDIDISESYCKEHDDGLFLGVNMTLLSFSNILVFNQLSEKIKKQTCSLKRYQKVWKAYNNHKKYFSDTYDEDDFFIITAYQDGISGRKECSNSGGTGLTKVIQSLERYSDSSKCYMITGNHILTFLHEYLDYDEDGYVGFNANNNYCDFPPHKDIMLRSPIFMPGVAYNLSFVYKHGDKDDG